MVKHEPDYTSPPAWIMLFLRWFCAESFLEEIEGDLFEMFQEDIENVGLSRAKRRFVINAIRYIKPFFWGKKDSLVHHILSHFVMLNHYFKISIRHIRRQRFYSFINITGFALGLACCLLILLFIRHELSYDQFHTQAAGTYRVVVDYHDGARQGMSSVTTTPVAQTIKAEYPEVLESARIAIDMYNAGANLIKKSATDRNIYEEGFIYADPVFLDMFDFPLISGHPDQVLTQPNSILLTERKARLLFPREDPLGKTLILNNNENNPFMVTGIIRDLPTHTHFQFDYILSMEDLEVSKLMNWGFSNFVTYVQLTPEADPKSLEGKLTDMIIKYKDPQWEEHKQAGKYFQYKLQPLTDIHLHSAGIRGYWTHGDIQYIWLFGAIALFILVIACINFVNLSTARSANRAKEVGIRKVLGSFRRQLIGQFLTESVLLSLIAFVGGLFLSALFLPQFNALANQSLTLPWGELWFLPTLLLVSISIGLVAGAYPSTYLSAFRPVAVLKGKLSLGSNSKHLRSTLVVLQFATSIVLIAGTIVVQRQLDYIQDKKLGFNKEQVLIIEDTYTIRNQIASFKHELSEISGVEKVSVTGYIPVEGYRRNGCGTWLEGNDPDETEVGLAKWYVDHDYIQTMGMQIIEGRDFSLDFPTDSQGIILNKKAVDLLGLEDPVGERISSYTYLDSKTGKLRYETYTVIGVLEDFHYESLKTNIEGLSLVIGGNTASTLIKTHSDNPKQLIADVAKGWEAFAPNQPFRYHFLDERFGAMYTFEQRVGKIYAVFAFLAIVIACLGLFALAAFLVEQRSKEVSIRKVLGASVASIFMLLTRNFVYLVLISFALAIPVAWFIMQKWLEDFVYRTSLSWDIFAIAGFIALFIAIATISYQAVRAAVVNPANMLRNE